MTYSAKAEWKEEIGIIALALIGIVLLFKGQDAGLIAAVIAAIGTIAGVKISRKA